MVTFKVHGKLDNNKYFKGTIKLNANEICSEDIKKCKEELQRPNEKEHGEEYQKFANIIKKGESIKGLSNLINIIDTDKRFDVLITKNEKEELKNSVKQRIAELTVKGTNISETIKEKEPIELYDKLHKVKTLMDRISKMNNKDELHKLVSDVIDTDEYNYLESDEKNLVLKAIQGREDMIDSNVFWGEPISSYTSDQAVEDGVLFDLTQVSPKWKKGAFNYITTNLMMKGYFNDDESVNIPNLIDLLNQVNNHFKKHYQDGDSRYETMIETPNGEKIKVIYALNEKNKFTIMLSIDD